MGPRARPAVQLSGPLVIFVVRRPFGCLTLGGNPAPGLKLALTLVTFLFGDFLGVVLLVMRRKSGHGTEVRLDFGDVFVQQFWGICTFCDLGDHLWTLGPMPTQA